MKIEMDDNSTITAVVLIAVIGILAGSLGGCHITNKTDREAIKAGLVQEPVPGQYLQWKKPTNPTK